MKLDKRSLKTPGGDVLALPVSKRLAASLVAHEWEKQEKLIKPHALPMVHLYLYCIECGIPTDLFSDINSVKGN